MANVSVAQNVNMLNVISGLMDGDVRPLTMSSTNYVVQATNGYRGDFWGQGMTYKNGEWDDGILQSFSISLNGQTLVTMDGLSVRGTVDVWDRGFDGNAPGVTSEMAYWLRDGDTITGAAGNEVLYGFGGNDRLIGGAGNDILNGGNGLDTAVFSGARSAYQLQSGNTQISGPDGVDTLISIERLQFDDMTLALDIDGNAGQAYRLYQAAFDRKPDSAGLKYWVSEIDRGVSLQTAASAFTQSAEFVALYGSTSPAADVLIEKMYLNVMHRASDAGGYNYWMGKFQTGEVNKNSLLELFADSAENKANVIGVIQNGIELV